MKFCLACLMLIVSGEVCLAWDGYDYQSGNYVEIPKGNLVRSGRDIEFYDSGSGEYRNLEVESIRRSGNSVIVEGIDSETGETRELEMDGE